ncbi:4247_t:CDS:1, partial [Scutellospora calospora]
MAIREVGCQNFTKKHLDIELEHTDQPLFYVRKISKVMNFLQPVLGSLPILTKDRTATYVIPDFCKQYPIRTSVFRSALIKEKFQINFQEPTATCHFTRLDLLLLVIELRTQLDLDIKDDILLEAITTASANMEMNHERLET